VSERRKEKAMWEEGENSCHGDEKSAQGENWWERRETRKLKNGDTKGEEDHQRAAGERQGGQALPKPVGRKPITVARQTLERRKNCR